MTQLRIGISSVNFASLVIEGESGRISVEPKVLEVLKALIDANGDVVIREDLIDQVWGVGFGGDERLSRAISLLRKALGDTRGNQQHIETIPRRGYRLIASVERLDRSLSPIQRNLGEDLRALAVLPFANVAGDAEGDFLVAGLCLDLNSLLSRVPGLHIVPHSSVMALPTDYVELHETAKKLGARNIVSGSLQRNGKDIRLRAQLICGETGAMLWAGKYATKLDDFFELQDDIVKSIATTVNSELDASAFQSFLKRQEFNLTAYEHIQSAEAQRWTYSRDAAERTIFHLRAAIVIEPDNVTAIAGLIGQLSQNLTSNWCEDRPAVSAEIREHLRMAQSTDPNHPEIVLAAGIRAVMTGRFDDAAPILERASELDPNNPHTRALLGWVRCTLYKDANAIDLIRSAEADAPHHPRFAIWANYRGHAEFALGNFEASLVAFDESSLRNPNYFLNVLASGYPLLLLGRADEATERFRQALAMEPRETLEYRIAQVEAFPQQVPDGHTMGEFTNLIRKAWPTD
ncbi:MAG: winged helix-turn-helix domain-containing protein [Pseudomonadota bacterium]